MIASPYMYTYAYVRRTYACVISDMYEENEKNLLLSAVWPPRLTQTSRTHKSRTPRIHDTSTHTRTCTCILIYMHIYMYFIYIRMTHLQTVKSPEFTRTYMYTHICTCTFAYIFRYIRMVRLKTEKSPEFT